MDKIYIKNILNRLTPRQRLKYGQKIDTLLNNFDIKKPIKLEPISEFTPSNIPSVSNFQHEFDVTKKKEEILEDKKDLDKKIDGMVNGSIIANYVKPSHQGLTLEEINKAHLVMASKLYDKGGKDLAQTYLDQKNMKKYKIDDELSDSNGLVVQNPEGNGEIAFRGTDIFNKEDIRTDLKVLQFLYPNYCLLNLIVTSCLQTLSLSLLPYLLYYLLKTNNLLNLLTHFHLFQ